MAHRENFSILVNGEIAYHPPKHPELQGEEVPATVASYAEMHGARMSTGERHALYALHPGESIALSTGETVTRVGGAACRTINVTYDIVTPESAEHGDVAERGYEESVLLLPEDAENHEGWVEAAVAALEHEGAGSLEADSTSGTPRWFTETAPAQDRAYFERGEEKRRSFHPEGFTDAELRELARELRVYGFRGVASAGGGLGLLDGVRRFWGG